MTARPGARRRVATAASVLAAALVLAGCAGDGDDLRSGDQGFVSSGGVITTIAVDQRQEPRGEVGGETLQGEDLALADLRGQVVVVNVWGSWCGPCIREAPELVAAAEELAERDVAFLGINTRDLSRDQAIAFERRFGVTYPSIFDPGGEQLLAFRGTIPPSAIPSTLVIDERGQIAVRVLGETTRATLVGLVEDVLDGPTSG